jgi:hypothetical protein
MRWPTESTDAGFIVGEDIRYSQEKGDLWVLDPDGKERKIPLYVRRRSRVRAYHFEC